MSCYKLVNDSLLLGAFMKDYNPLFPNRKKEEVTLSDVVGSFFDVIRAAVPTENNPVNAKITYTTPKGDDFNINLEIKPKSQK